MKKHIIVEISILVTVLLVVFVLLQNTHGVLQRAIANLTPVTWRVYTDKADGYSIAYPSNLHPYEYPGIPGFPNSVDFADNPTDMFAIGVSVATTTFSDPSVLTHSGHDLIQKRITVDGYNALLTYAEGDRGSSNDKNVMLLKDGKIYTISIGTGNDSEDKKVLDSFHFLK